MQVINFFNDQTVPLSDDVEELIVLACKSVLSIENFSDDAEISVTLVDADEIRALNRDFRNIDRATDVLSFPLGENGEYDTNPENGCLMLGDVIINVNQALTQANEFGHSKEREIAYLTVHSVLHLLGYDHVDEADEKKLMRKKEEEALSLLGLNIKSEEN